MTGQERDDLARELYERNGGTWDTEGSWFEWDRNLYREDADAILASDWLRERDQRIKAEVRALGHAEGVSDATHDPRDHTPNPPCRKDRPMKTPNTDLAEQIEASARKVMRRSALVADVDLPAHIAAAVLPIVEAEVRKAKAEALRSAAEMIEDMRNGAEIAGVAAYVPGEVGRQNVIDSFEAAMDEPGDWLRSLADTGEADTYREDRVNDWLAEAWDEGRLIGATALHPHYQPNPYRKEQDS